MEYFSDYLAHNSEAFAHKPAIVTDSKSLSWSELHAAVMQAAANIPSDLPPQSVIGILLPNSWQFVVCYLAIVHAGHIAMPFDPNFKKIEISALIEQIKPKYIISNLTKHTELPEESLAIDADKLITEQPAAKLRLPAYTPADQQIVSLLFTSGTTGKPKCTPYTHRNYIWNIEAVSELWQWNKDETLLVSLPLSHWHGLAMGLCGALYHGNTVYLQERFSAEETLTMLSSGKISLFMHVPIAYLLMTQVPNSERFDLSHVRLCVSGSSYLPPEVWHDFYGLYGHKILERYGASEMGLLCSNTLDERMPGSVGYPLADVSVRIEADGQIAMKSPGLFPGYYNNEAATNDKCTQDGWWLSGDIGEQDASGRITLKGRVQEKMKKYGYTIYPRDLEWALLEHPLVQDVFVLGQQDAGRDGMSDKIIYFVVSSASELDLQEFCRQNMPSFWRPDQIILVDEIPKSPAGKPKLAKLKEIALNYPQTAPSA